MFIYNCDMFPILFLLLPYLSLAQDELVFVQIIYRHGDRTPVKPYPTDPYKNNSFWPTGFGQLTNVGKRQHFELGQWFRQRYSGFLPEKYSLNDIYVRSTDVDRTLMSAESNLAGLYSPNNTDIWNPDIKWQPIPVHTIPEKIDAVLGAKKPCPPYQEMLDELLANAEFQNINIRLQSLYDFVSNNTGKKIRDIQELEYLYNTLYIEDLYKLPLPNWTKLVYPEKLLPWAHLSFKIYCYTPELTKLKVGLLLNEITERMVNKTKGILKPDRKMWVYSAHDTTIANVLMGLGAFDAHCPPYTSTIIFELRHSQETGFYVNTFYKNDTTAHPISISGCDFRCPLPDMQFLLRPISITEEEWENVCSASYAERHPWITFLNNLLDTILYMLAGILIFVACFATFVFGKYVYRRIRRNSYEFMNSDSDSDSSD